jgi:F0F1-type ATP synthase membrane subunit b/b'
MTIEIGLVQNFLFAILAVGLVVALFALLKNVLSGKDQKPRTKKNNLSQMSDKIAAADYKHIIKKAHKHAKTLLQDTTAAAGEILSGTRQTNEHLEEQLDKVLQGIAATDIHTLKTTTAELDADYQKSLQSVQEQMRQAALEMIQNTKKEYDEKLEAFTNTLLRTGMETQTTVNKKAEELLATADSEIAEYKKEKIEKIDQEVSSLVQKVYRDVLRMSIPENVHQDLVLKSLDEAKKDGLFKL